ncbi:MAG: NAD(P)(+) transhydrogenase (Re/Si-specific) subunit beta, partial [Cypionkella sp.]
MLTSFAQIAIVVADLAAAFLFLFGLKRMSSPVTAPSGIAYAGIGMVVAVVASFLYALSVAPAAQPHLLINIALALIALALGGGLAWRSGSRAALTEMPQMVALLNGAGGGAAAAIAAIVLLGGVTAPATLIVTLAGALIGSVSLSGSLIAWGKLDGLLKHPLRFKGQQAVNGIAFLLTLAVGAYIG